jgi:hypothetical protein
LPHLKERYASQEFESTSHLVQRISDQDTRVFEPKKNWSKKVSFVREVEDSDSDSDKKPVIGLAEWVKNKSRYLVPLVRKSQKSLPFISSKPTRYLIFYFKRVRLNCHLIM